MSAQTDQNTNPNTSFNSGPAPYPGSAQQPSSKQELVEEDIAAVKIDQSQSRVRDGFKKLAQNQPDQHTNSGVLLNTGLQQRVQASNDGKSNITAQASTQQHR